MNGVGTLQLPSTFFLKRKKKDNNKKKKKKRTIKLPNFAKSLRLEAKTRSLVPNLALQRTTIQTLEYTFLDLFHGAKSIIMHT